MSEQPEIVIEPARPEITLERLFDAPRRQVFDAWTKAEQVKRWYCPGGVAISGCDIDLRVNGKWRLVWRGAQGLEYGVSGEFREIRAPERLVQTFRYDGAPRAEALETLVFSEKDGKTLLTSKVVHKSAENRDWHMTAGLREGATQILDRLSDYLQSNPSEATGAETESEASGAAAPRREPNWKIAAAGLVIVVLAGGALYRSSRLGVLPFAQEAAQGGAASRIVSASGVIACIGAAPIRANASGTIAAIHCDNGANVVAGQICAQIDQGPYQSIIDREKVALADAVARLEQDKAGLSRASADLERNERSAKRRASARSALETSRAARERAQSRVTLDEGAITQARVALRAAEAELGKTEIVSPIDGTVASRNVEIGQTVETGESGKELFLVAPDLAAMQVDARVSPDEAREIAIGDEASFTVDAIPDRVYAGKVSRILRSQSSDRALAERDGADRDVVNIDAPNPDLSLTPGMKATVQIVLEKRDPVVFAPDGSLR
jgi:RND family efflux transporter MFP subunit